LPRTMFEKIWESHVVDERPGEPALLYIDLHLVHEVAHDHGSPLPEEPLGRLEQLHDLGREAGPVRAVGDAMVEGEGER